MEICNKQQWKISICVRMWLFQHDCRHKHTHTHIRQRRIQRTSTQCPNVTNILENVTHPTEQKSFKTECFSFVWKNATDSHSNWCAD